MYLNNQDWQLIRKHLNLPKKRKDGKGRPRADDRLAFEAILSVLIKGIRWRDITYPYPCYVSCFARYRQWSHDGSLLKAMGALLKVLDQKGKLKKEESIFDGSFIPSKKTDKGFSTGVKVMAASGDY